MHFKKAYCKDCEDNVKAESRGANHLLHLILTFVTFGFWIVVWIIAAASRNWTCAECGGRRLARSKSKKKLAALAEA
jgi:hypothetical protein